MEILQNWRQLLLKVLQILGSKLDDYDEQMEKHGRKAVRDTFEVMMGRKKVSPRYRFDSLVQPLMTLPSCHIVGEKRSGSICSCHEEAKKSFGFPITPINTPEYICLEESSSSSKSFSLLHSTLLTNSSFS